MVQTTSLVVKDTYILSQFNPLVGILKTSAVDHYTAIRWWVHWPL